MTDIMKKFELLQELPKYDRDTEVNSYFQKNDIDKTCSMQLVTNFEFVKKQKYL